MFSFRTVHFCLLEWRSSVLILRLQIGAVLHSDTVKYSSEKLFIFFCHLEMWVNIELKFLTTCFAVYK